MNRCLGILSFYLSPLLLSWISDADSPSGICLMTLSPPFKTNAVARPWIPRPLSWNLLSHPLRSTSMSVGQLYAVSSYFG